MLSIKQLRTALIGPLDLDLRDGTCTAIHGPSGAGKSLFLRAIADLDDNSGAICLNGLPRSTFSAPGWRRKVAYVPAESGWWADRVADHFAGQDGLAPLLDAVGLKKALSWQVSRLSTGERQRLALIRALQLQPSVLLLDEPTSALDPPTTTKVEALLRAQMEAQCTILIVTHDPDQPARLGARQMRMRSGRLEPSAPGEAAA